MLNMKKIFKTKVNDRAFEQNDERRTSLFSKIRFSEGFGGAKGEEKEKNCKKSLANGEYAF